MDGAGVRGVALRPRTADDADFMRAIDRSTRIDELRAVPWSEAEKAAFLDMQFRAQTMHYDARYPAAEYLVIEVDDIPAGRLYVDRTASGINVLDIALLPQWRGRGIGGALLKAILDEARAAARTVILHVEQYNPARRLYERLGFEALGSNGVYERMEWRAPAEVT